MSNFASKARRSKNTIRLSRVNFREGKAQELVNSQRHLYQRISQPTFCLRGPNALPSAGGNLIAHRFTDPMINRHCSPGHHCFQMTQTLRVGDAPTYASQHYGQRIRQPFEHVDHSGVRGLDHSLHRSSRDRAP